MKLALPRTPSQGQGGIPGAPATKPGVTLLPMTSHRVKRFEYSRPLICLFILQVSKFVFITRFYCC